MSKRDQYVKALSKTNFVSGLTTSIVAEELGARALLKILMDKGIISLEEWNDAVQFVTERFVDLHTHDFDESTEPDFLDFTKKEE